MRTVPLFLLAAVCLHAEFLHVQLQVNNMDCATCVKSLEIGLKKIKGVEKVAVTADGVEFVLQPGNRVTLERLRDQIKGVGFTPGSASVVVKGKPMTSNGQWRFEIEGLGQVYSLSASAEQTIRDLRGKDAQLVTVKAASPVPPDPRTTPGLQVATLLTQ